MTTRTRINIELIQDKLLLIKLEIINLIKIADYEEINININVERLIRLIILLEDIFKYYQDKLDTNNTNHSLNYFVRKLGNIEIKIKALYDHLPITDIKKFGDILHEFEEMIHNIVVNTDIPESEIDLLYKTINIKEIININDFKDKVKVKKKNINELESEIKNLQKQIDKNDSTELKKELLKKEEELNRSIKEKEELEKKAKEYDIYLDERKKIISAIEKLNIPAKVLDDEKEHYLGTRKIYNFISGIMFGLSFCIFIVLIFSVHFDLSYVKSSEKINLSFYFFTIFPILFPTFVGFLFIRQSNINSKEIEKINKRFVLIHEINQSLLALVEINRGKGMDNKTEKIVDKLISNILNYSTENNKNENEETNIFGLNESIDKLIDTIDKKLTVIGKSE